MSAYSAGWTLTVTSQEATPMPPFLVQHILHSLCMAQWNQATLMYVFPSHTYTHLYIYSYPTELFYSLILGLHLARLRLIPNCALVVWSLSKGIKLKFVMVSSGSSEIKMPQGTGKVPNPCKKHSGLARLLCYRFRGPFWNKFTWYFVFPFPIGCGPDWDEYFWIQRKG